jgi:hypothetical protein
MFPGSRNLFDLVLRRLAGKARDSACSRPVAFLHIPKTGGTFITQSESDGKSVISPIINLNHVTVLDYDADFELDVAKPYAKSATVSRHIVEQYNVFSNVRNTYSFFVSYMCHAGGLNPKYRDTSHYDFNAAQKGFDYLLKTVADRVELWPSRRFINYMLFSQPSGEFIPSWINYTEKLNADLVEMARRYKLCYVERPKQRVSGWNDYRRFYTSDLVDLVSKTWAREISIFNFDFEHSGIWCGRENASIALRKLDYVWRKDELRLQRASTSPTDRLKATLTSLGQRCLSPNL